jgi:D-beta-D-heptose 7-phosphate kinase / D-beta-D-heptose 1-phosphate adenosyltransferase
LNKLDIPDYQGARVLVVGDLMLDRYWLGDARRVSQEAPVPVVEVDGIDERPGGAANVALNVAALGAHCTLVGVVGDDEAADALEKKLSGAGVHCCFIRQADWPTIVKLRVLSQQQQLLRMDFEQPLGDAHWPALCEQIRQALPDADALIIEDYDKGTLVEPTALIELAHAAGKPVLVDPKFKPFSAYQGADLVKPNRIEFQHAVGGWQDFAEFVQKGAELALSHQIGALVVTRGGEGMTLIHQDGRHHHVPALAVDVFDETGAGDTVAATLASSLAAGCPLEVCTGLANLAAGIVVTKTGTATVSAPELQRRLSGERHIDRGAMATSELLDAVEQAHAAGQKLVFTNGCFDILHAGHVGYLEEARALGDRLIVAVNDDASVARLKGPGRPVNSLAQRMKVLSGLAAVDWVVAFAEDTPEALLRQIRPDVLVKGGDYSVDQVVGADIVRGYGGEVRVLSVVENLSTTAIVERIRERS